MKKDFENLRLKQLVAPKAQVGGGFPSLPNFGVSGFAGVPDDPTRGYLYFPEMEARHEVKEWDRKHADRKARWLYANVGIVRRLIRAQALKVVGRGFTVQPATGDPEWNAMRKAAWENRTKSPLVWDVAGRVNFNEWLRVNQHQKVLRGEMFSAMVRSETGGLMVKLYDPNAIGNGKAGADGGWVDGVKLNRHSRPVAYRVLGKEGAVSTISAQDMRHYCDNERPNGARGITGLIHAINHLVDIVETRAYLKQGIKLASTIGYYLKRSAGAMTSPGGGMAEILSGVPRDAGDGQDPIAVSEIYGGGRVKALGINQDIEVLRDDRPHANGMDFEKTLLRDVTLGLGFPPEVMLDPSSVGTSAAARLSLIDLREWVHGEQDELLVDCAIPAYVMDTAIEISRGNLPLPKVGNWWDHGWLLPGDSTLDIGRDGRLRVTEYEHRMVSLANIYGERGQDWKEQVNEWLDEKEHIAREVKRRVAESGGVLSEADFEQAIPGVASVRGGGGRESEEEEDAAE